MHKPKYALNKIQFMTSINSYIVWYRVLLSGNFFLIINEFKISSFRRVQNVVCFLLGDSPASDLYMPTFRNTLSVPSSKAGVK